MRIRGVKVTDEMLNRLMEKVRSSAAAAHSPHLGDEEFEGYAAGTMAVEEFERADLHLAACDACSRGMEAIVLKMEPWQGEAGANRLAALREQVLAQLFPRSEAAERLRALWDRLRDEMRGAFILTDVALTGASAASAQEPQRGGTRSGDLTWSISFEPDDQLIVWFYTNVLLLRGARCWVKAGGKQWDLVLRQVSPDQVGGKVYISRKERERWAGEHLEVGVSEAPWGETGEDESA